MRFGRLLSLVVLTELHVLPLTLKLMDPYSRSNVDTKYYLDRHKRDHLGIIPYYLFLSTTGILPVYLLIVIICFLLTLCLDYYPNDACALNMLGVLEEWNGLYLKSSKHLRNGIANLSGEQRDIAYCNLGHVYLQLKSYDESVLCYECIKTMDFSSQCGLALAQFKSTFYNFFINIK